MEAHLLSTFGFESPKALTVAHYNRACADFAAPPVTAAPGAEIDQPF